MGKMSRDKEVWKPVVGFEGLYEVSNTGKVKKGDRIKLTRVDKGGYETVCLFDHCKQKHMKVHRVVAMTFIPNPKNKRTVNHIDGNKLNNNVENLEWATHSENIIHANKMGLRVVTEAQRKAASINGKKTCALNRIKTPVEAYNHPFDESEHCFESAHEAARFVNGSPSPIVACCKGKKKTYKGYMWRYSNGSKFTAKGC